MGEITLPCKRADCAEDLCGKPRAKPSGTRGERSPAGGIATRSTGKTGRNRFCRRLHHGPLLAARYDAKLGVFSASASGVEIGGLVELSIPIRWQHEIDVRSRSSAPTARDSVARKKSLRA